MPLKKIISHFAGQPAAASASVAGPSAAEIATKLARLETENARLKMEARRYGTIINSSINPIWQRDEQFNIVYCNLAFTEIAEQTAEDVLALGDMELYSGHRSLAQKAWESGQEQFDRRHIVVNGERRLYMIRELPMKKENTIIGYATHISELEAAQEEIQRHVSALRDLLESSTSAMAIYGRDQKLKFYNFAFTALWKLDEAWLDTEPSYGEVLELLREKRRLPEQANFKAFKQAQQKLFTALIAPEEEFFYRPDGKTLRVIAIPHALGGILFAYEDVTDRLALERSYNTLIAVQRETLDNLHEAVAVFGENWRLRLSNPVFQTMWKLDNEYTSSEPHLRELLDHCRALFNTQNWPEFMNDLLTRFQQRQFFKIRFERADGMVIDCQSVPLPDGATLLSFIDVTDSTLVERSLRERTEALEAADKLKSEFLANMSYELRSPLTSISGFAEMLAREYAGKLNERQKEYVDGVYQSSQALAALITDIIDLATIEAGYLKLERQSFDLRAALENCVSLLREQLKAQHLSITITVARDIHFMHGDEVRIKQIVMHLINNAARVNKARRHIALDAAASETGIRLSVRDDGPGVDATRRAHIFDPFFRGVSGQGSDAALGLSLVKRFVELHGGSVSVTYDEATGTVIYCDFPLPQQTA